MTDSSEKRRRPSILYWIFTISLILMLGVSIFINMGLGIALSLSPHGLTEEPERAVDEFPGFDEEWSYGDGEVKVVRLELTGFIMRGEEAGLFEPPHDRMEDLMRAIRAAAHDAEVKAIILETDSPGGSVTTSDEIYYELLRFKASGEGRKVVIYMRDLAASGAYYVAMAGDWLIAQPTTIVGSIGVIMQTLNWKGLSERIGVTDTTIKSGENKDLLNPFREADTNQLALLQGVIDRMHERFRGIVSAGRGIPAEELSSIADGRIFSSGEALELKLVDQIGYWNDAVARTAELLGVPSVKVIRYYQEQSFFDYLLSAKNPVQLWRQSLTRDVSRLHYLWQP